jgi:outer membrane receptor protein involved in Fe transport
MKSVSENMGMQSMRMLNNMPMAVAFQNRKALKKQKAKMQKVGVWSAVLAALCTTLVLGTTIAAPPAEARSKTYNLDIPSQSLNDALQNLALASQHKLLYSSELVEGKKSPALKGQFTTEQAVKALLSGTKLTYEVTSDGLVLIRDANAPPTGNLTGSSSLSHERGEGSGLMLAQSDPSSSPAPSQGEGRGEVSKAADERRKAGSSAQGEGLSTIPEIIVTAQKRSEKLQDVPASVQVLSGVKLEEEGVVQLSDYAKLVPGLTLTGASAPGQGKVTLRGIASGTGSSPLVGVYLDDVPMTPSSPNSDATGGACCRVAFDPDLADIERIEVLEGPQSTLYGASSMGGVLKFVTKQPDLTNFGGSIRIDGSKLDGGGAGYGVRGTVNIPVVTDTIGLRASAFYRDDPGFVDNDFNGVKNVNHDSVKGVRLALRVKFTDDLETTLNGLVQNIDTFGPNLVYLNPQTLRPALGGLAYSSPFNQGTSVENRTLGDTTTLNLHFATLTNIASYAETVAHVNLDDSIYLAFVPPFSAPPGIFMPALFNAQSRRFSDELRLVSSPGNVEWLLGGFYTHENDPDSAVMRGTDSAGVTLPSSSPYYNFFNYNNTSIFNEKAVFGDLTYHLTDRLEGTVGMRYSVNDQSFNAVDSGLLVGGVTAGLAGASRDSAETYLGTVTYKPTSNTSLYLRAASAYRPGGPNVVSAQLVAAAGAPPTFGPDRLWNYEAGINGSLWNQRITYSVRVYHMDWTDIQLNVLIHGVSVVANASSAKSDGMEASLQLAPIDGLTVSLNGAYSNAKLTSDISAPVNAVKGDPLPFAPKTAAAAVLDYRLADFNGVVPRAGFTAAYHGSERTAFTTSAGYTLPSYATLDLRGGIDWSRYSLIARIDNVANRYALTDVEPNNATGTPLGGIVIKPRTFGISLMALF